MEFLLTGIPLCGTFDKIEINHKTRAGRKEIVTCRESNRIMNVLIINASPRKKGITSTLLDEVKRVINPTYRIDTVRIQDLEIRPCTGCLKCRPDKPCVLPKDDAHILAEKIKEADLLIIGSPVYWGNMPGTLKLFFDRNVPLFE